MTTKYLLLGAGAGLLAMSPLMADPGGKGGDKGGQGKAEKGNPGNGGADKGNSAKGGGDKGNSGNGGQGHVGKDHGKADHAGKADHGNKDFAKYAKRAKGSFRDEDYPLFREYFLPYRDEPMNLPPGLAKRLRDGKPLPEGWRDKFVPGSMLEDAYWDSMIPLPDDMRGRLPRGDDSRYYLIDGQLVRVHPTERRVMGLISLIDLLTP